MTDILTEAREQVLERGEGLTQDQVLAVLRLPDDRLDELLAIAHDVRMRWCGPEVEVEGIISLKTGGCPEDCHFCSQSGLFASPVRSAWLDIPSLVEAAKQTAKTGATEFCIVAAVRGPDERLLAQAKLIEPGHPERSLLYARISRRGPGQMPPLATAHVDEPARQMIHDWIKQMKPERR